MADTPQQQEPEALDRDAEELNDLSPSEQEAEDVKGGMTKPEFIQRVAQKSGLSSRDAGKAAD